MTYFKETGCQSPSSRFGINIDERAKVVSTWLETSNHYGEVFPTQVRRAFKDDSAIANFVWECAFWDSLLELHFMNCWKQNPK